MQYVAIFAALCVSLTAAAAVAKEELYCPPTWEGEDVLYPKPENCSEFYKCSGEGKLVTIPCQPGLYYCAEKQWCDFETNCDFSNCKIHPVVPSEPGSGGDGNEGNGGDVGTGNGDQTETGEMTCPQDEEGFQIMYPNPDNCKEFYQCNFGKLVKIACQGNLYFSPSNNWCDYAENFDHSHCKMNPTEETKPEEGNGGDEDNDNNQGNNGGDEGTGQMTCPQDKEGFQIMYPNPDNCKEFYQCNYGQIVKLSCQGDLYFSPSNNWCDYAQNFDHSHCKMVSNEETKPEQGNGETEPEQGNGDKEQENEDAEVLCSSGTYKEGDLIPNPQNCNEFFQCSIGHAYLKTCPAGLYYCATEKVCDYPQNCDHSNCRAL